MPPMSTPETIRVGVIGTGFGSLVQIPGFQRSPGVEVVAVASGRPERARQVAEKFGLQAGYGDYRQMLAEQRLDLVRMARPQGGVDAMTPFFPNPGPLENVSDNRDAAARPVPTFGMKG